MNSAVFLTLVGSLLLFAGISCEEAPRQAVAEKKSSVPLTDYEIGLELLAQNDCLSCHQVEQKSIGPSYRAIALKYDSTEENLQSLASKIQKGGTGVWGTIPMTPHPQLSAEDARMLVRYIFSLKKPS